MWLTKGSEFSPVGQSDFEIGAAFRERLVPHAVLWCALPPRPGRVPSPPRSFAVTPSAHHYGNANKFLSVVRAK